MWLTDFFVPYTVGAELKVAVSYCQDTNHCRSAAIRCLVNRYGRRGRSYTMVAQTGRKT